MRWHQQAFDRTSLVLVALMAACSGTATSNDGPQHADGAASACVPGQQTACACLGAPMGVQRCSGTGTGYLDCQCPGLTNDDAAGFRDADLADSLVASAVDGADAIMGESPYAEDLIDDMEPDGGGCRFPQNGPVCGWVAGIVGGGADGTLEPPLMGWKYSASTLPGSTRCAGERGGPLSHVFALGLLDGAENANVSAYVGVTFWIRSAGAVGINIDDTQGRRLAKDLTTGNDWQKMTVPFSDPSSDDAATGLDLTHILDIVFFVPANTKFDLCVDNVALIRPK